MKIVLKYYALTTAIVVFVFYLFSMAPGIVEIDSGELSAVQLLAGIAHPTGYPLFTMLGYIWGLLPLPFAKAYQMNLLAGVYTAAAVGVFIQTASLFLANITYSKLSATQSKGAKHKAEVNELKQVFTEPVIVIASVLSGILLAVSKTFWLQSTATEVYSLHLLLVTLSLFAFLKMYFSQEPLSYKSLILTGVTLALSFTNHMTTILLLPAYAVLFFARYKFEKSTFLSIAKALPFAVLTLVVMYSYLPIRASFEPLLNWGNPVTSDSFMRHFLGKQYSVWLFTGGDSAAKQFSQFVSNFPKEFTGGVLFILVGLVALFAKSKKLFLFITLLVTGTVGYSINYDIVDIDTYFLLAYIALALSAAMGFAVIFEKLTQKRLLVGGVLVALILSLHIGFTFPAVNRSSTTLFEDYTKTALNSLEPNAVLLTYLWDYFYSPSLYVQGVEKVRTDVDIIEKELVRRSWYHHLLKVHHNDVYKLVEAESDAFVSFVTPFELDEEFNPNTLEISYRSFFETLIRKAVEKRPVYISFELVMNEIQWKEIPLPEGVNLVPDLFFYRVTTDTAYIEAPLPNFDFNFEANRNNSYCAFMETEIIGEMLLQRAQYELAYNKPERAKIYIQKVQKDIPELVIPEQMLQAIK